jgi:glutamate-1-semialdehyde 2,1-aminomutase
VAERSTFRSAAAFERAAKVIPGGVNSPVRAFRAVGGNPFFVQRAEGPWLYDIDGNRYLDCIGSWGPMLFGHSHPRVLDAVRQRLADGLSYGAPTELEVEMAEEICSAVPSIEMVRLVSSGTEACMSAIRLARGATGRSRIVKFEGCYHGHGDSLLAKAGSGVATLGLPDSAGVPPKLTEDTLTLPFNSTAAVEGLFSQAGDTIAAVIVEPAAGNMGCVPPQPGFLQCLRDVTRQAGALLIFDEVMTGFRLARGGAQERFGILPDITTLGKIVGGGLPLAAYGGSREIMQCVAPVGTVYQAGTLSGNPIAVTAGLTTLRMIAEDTSLYARLEILGAQIAEALRLAAARAGVPVVVNQVGSMLTLFFTPQAVTDYSSAKTSDTAKFAAFFRAMLDAGVYLPPSQFEAAFLSAAITDAEAELLVKAAETSLLAAAGA